MPNRSPWEPTWRRLAGTTVVLFAVILAFLAGRVRAGADPGLRSSATQTLSQPDTVSPPATETPADPSQQDFGAPQVAPDEDPPSTHVS